MHSNNRNINIKSIPKEKLLYKQKGVQHPDLVLLVHWHKDKMLGKDSSC